MRVSVANVKNRLATGAALLAACLTLSACASRKPEIEKLSAAAPQVQSVPVAYSSFWEAMENLDFDTAGKKTSDAEQLKFMTALQRVETGDLRTAEPEFADLCKTARDPLVRKHAAGILQSILFHESKWTDLLNLGKDPSYGDIEDRNLAEAYGRAPKETYQFAQALETLPLTLSATGSPIVPVTINGHQKKFWLDTGASVSVLASDIAAECGVMPANALQQKTQTATSREVASRPAIISDLAIGSLRIRNHPAIILRKEDLEFKILKFIRVLKIDGILGWNLIQNMDIDVDYAAKRITFRKPVPEASINRNLFWIGYPVVTVQADNGRTLRFGLDTGAEDTSIRENLFKKVIAANTKTQKVETGSAGGFEQMVSRVLPSLSIQVTGYRVRFREISTRESGLATFIKLDGVLGSDIASGGRIRLDSTNGRFVLSR